MITEFAESWALFDPCASHYMPYEKLPLLLERLYPPLGFKGVEMDSEAVNNFIEKQLKVPLQDDQVHFCETLVALAKYTYGPSEVDQIEENGMRLIARKLGDRFPSLIPSDFSQHDIDSIIRLQAHIRRYVLAIQKEKNEVGEAEYLHRLALRHEAIREAQMEAEELEEAVGLSALLEEEAPPLLLPGPAAPELIAQLHEAVTAIFSRYDFDGSESINDARELEQLTMNLVFKLELPAAKVNMAVLSHAYQQVGDFSDGIQWRVDDFKAWFCAAVLIDMCGIIVTPQQLGLSHQPVSPCKQLYLNDS